MPEPALKKVRKLLVGRARSPTDSRVFHHLSLIAFFAWVGLGADGLSSSCYGPEEAFRAMGAYPYLTIFVALASAFTVLIISTSYTQIIEEFPSGGGGYVVASKLLSPSVGMVSGCALLLDYVLTIAISIASGADALFSFIPKHYHTVHLPWTGDFSSKMLVIFLALALLTLMNLRGVKESVVPLVPIFLVFVATHAFVIVTVVIIKVTNLPMVIHETATQMGAARSQLGILGMIGVMMRAYSMGAGTYTGIEAVSNGMPILREPRVETGRRTMRYMGISLAIMVVGLMLAYLLFNVQAVEGKTLNAVLFDRFTQSWPWHWGPIFVWVTLISEAAILFIAAQAGFLDGPRVLSNMAQDRWMPHKFATLSDRLVTHNGVILMSGAGLITILCTGASVGHLVVLYSINVFITFSLSQLGMVRHWLQQRRAKRAFHKGLVINATGLVLCVFILTSVVYLKFSQGAWITLILTGSLVVVCVLIKDHYEQTQKLLRRLDALVQTASAASSAPSSSAALAAKPTPAYDPTSRTAVLLISGFNGIGLHVLLNVVKLFPNTFKNFLFVQIGVFDAGNFKGIEAVGQLRDYCNLDTRRYIDFVNSQGFHGEALVAMGTDVVDEVARLAPDVLRRFPNAVFFGGQLVFPHETFFTRWLHNFTVFALQRRFYSEGIPLVILPIRV